MNISFLLYPVDRVKISEDSSFWIQKELQRRGHHVSYFESKDLFCKNNGIFAYARKAKLHPAKGYLPSPRPYKALNLSELDCLFIRKEPPFDESYVYALQILRKLEESVFILNRPSGILSCNEKIATTFFPKHCPESIVTENTLLAKIFIRNLKKAVIVKPLNQKGGSGIFSTSSRDRNLASLLDLATQSGKQKIMIQRFVSADRHGDKRIVLLNGEILGAFLRRPSKNDVRANLSVGATLHDAAITESDKKIVESLRPYLLQNGLFFTGIDVIGPYLTEINVTSPAGIPEINLFKKQSCEKKVVDFIERLVGR